MAGGVGSRFWPMSTTEKPKQFIDVLGIGKTLLQLTVERFGNHLGRHQSEIRSHRQRAVARHAGKQHPL